MPRALSEGLARADREKRFVALSSVVAAVFLTAMVVIHVEPREA